MKGFSSPRDSRRCGAWVPGGGEGSFLLSGRQPAGAVLGGGGARPSEAKEPRGKGEAMRQIRLRFGEPGSPCGWSGGCRSGLTAEPDVHGAAVL